MLEFQKKKRIKSFIYSRVSLVLILAVTIFFINAVANFYQKAAESKNRKKIAEMELMKTQERRDNLEERVRRLDSPIGVEEELRARFDLIKDGERTILINDDDLN